MVRPSLIDRVAALERSRGVGTRLGLAMLDTLIYVDGYYSELDVIAIDVGPEHAPQRLDHLPGESIEALEARANPHGGWQAYPRPVFTGVVRRWEERVAERNAGRGRA